MQYQQENEYEIVVEAVKPSLFFPQRAQFSTIRKAPSATRAEAEFLLEMELEIRRRGIRIPRVQVLSVSMV